MLDHRKMASVSRSIEVDVSPEQFVRVVQDYARYPEFVPELKSVRVGPWEGEAVEVTYWLDAQLRLYDFTLRHEVRGPSRIEWNLVRGGDFMRKNRGAWTIERTSAGHTKATYAIEIDLGPLVPSNFEKALAERGLPNLLSNFKTRAEQLFHGGEQRH
jgi:coenzyme Q-binding protein COQ10